MLHLIKETEIGGFTLIDFLLRLRVEAFTNRDKEIFGAQMATKYGVSLI